MTIEKVFPILVVVWVGLGLMVAVFHLKAPLAMKRLWHPRIVIGIGFLFAAFIAMAAPDWRPLVVLIPIVVGFSYANLKMIEFCPGCGVTRFRSVWTKSKACSRCGVAP